jgi:hypothetical protein
MMKSLRTTEDSVSLTILRDVISFFNYFSLSRRLRRAYLSRMRLNAL